MFAQTQSQCNNIIGIHKQLLVLSCIIIDNNYEVNFDIFLQSSNINLDSIWDSDPQFSSQMWTC